MKHRHAILVLSALLLASCGGNSSSSASSQAGTSSKAETSSLPEISSIKESTVEDSSKAEEFSSKDIVSSEEPASSIESSEESSSQETHELQGDGSKNNPYKPDCVDHLKQLVEIIDSPVSSNAVYIELGSDIDGKGASLTPIGRSTEAPFHGHFNGKGHTISNVVFKQSTVAETGGKIAGLFGYVENAEITNVNFDHVSIEEELKEGAGYYGIAAAYATNSAISNVWAKDASVKVTAGPRFEEGYSSMVGGLVGKAAFNGNLMYVWESLAFEGSIETDLPLSSAGGIIGYTQTGAEAFFSITNSFANMSSLKGGYYAGGITGNLDYYCSIVSSYVKANSIEALDKGGASAGGLVGYGNRDSFIKDALIDVSTIAAAHSGQTLVPGSSGAIYGYAVSSEFENWYHSDAASFHNVAGKVDELIGDETYLEERMLRFDTPDASLLNQLGLATSYWAESETGYPALTLQGSSSSITLTINPNKGVAPETDHIESAEGMYGLLVLNAAEESTREGYFFSQYYYDEDCVALARFYVPSFIDYSIYADWTDAKLLVGTYSGKVYHSSGSEYPANPGSFEIKEDRTYIWRHAVGGKAEGRLEIYGDHFIMVGTGGDTGYSGMTGTFSEGELIFDDANSEDYYYVWTREATPEPVEFKEGVYRDQYNNTLTFKEDGVVIYDNGSQYTLSYSFDDQDNLIVSGSAGYLDVIGSELNDQGQIIITFDDGESPFSLTFTLISGDPVHPGEGGDPEEKDDFETMVGTWYNGKNNYVFEIDEDGDFVYYSAGGVNQGSGSITATDTEHKYKVYALGAFAESYLTYDQQKQLFYGGFGKTGQYGPIVISRQKTTFCGIDETNKDGLYVFEDGTCAILINNELVDGSYEGELVDKGVITITVGAETRTYKLSQGYSSWTMTLQN